MSLRKIPGGLPESVTVPTIYARKATGEKISALTAYDFLTGKLLDEAGVDIVLVGDSLGNIVQGHDTTLPVTLQEMIYHCKCVSRGVKRALVVGDMPFLSYQVSEERAIESAGLMIKEGGVAAVKLEGGLQVASIVRKIVSFDIPVMGHVGLTPQSVHSFGGYKVQGRDNAQKVIDDACVLDEAGVFSIVIEGVPDEVAAEITSRVKAPTIGIGAGIGCDGQILVTQDMLGMTDRRVPKFVKQFETLRERMTEAVKSYITEVGTQEFPSEEYSYGKQKLTKASQK